MTQLPKPEMLRNFIRSLDEARASDRSPRVRRSLAGMYYNGFGHHRAIGVFHKSQLTTQIKML
jgi:hypothetical protein